MNKTVRGIFVLLILISIVVIPFLILSLTKEDTTDQAKDEFSKYYNGKNDVVLSIEDNLYFENYVLDFKETYDNFVSSSIIFANNKIYFLSLKSTNLGYKNEALEVFSCDYFAENIELVYSKTLNIYSKLKVVKQNYCYLLEYEKENEIFIDKYNIFTGIYENLTRGKDCNLSQFVEQENFNFAIEKTDNSSRLEHGKFVITNLETNQKRTIDDDYLKNTVYFKSMEKFNFAPKRYDVSNGHILITYEIGAGDGWNFSHLVFEYDFENDKLEYKLLAFPYDSVPVEIIYIS